MKPTDIQQIMQKIKDNVKQVIVGKDEVIDLLLVSLITSGHVLLEDVPGTGKTMLAKAMAKSMNCQYKRIQFTPDLLPSDLSGIHFYNQKTGDFEFRAGPLFSNILLADEINRATPRTQSSLLECMEERQVTIDGETRTLDRPFLVIATQNPIDNQGTFPLPEAQLDRFLLKVRMGYPSEADSMEILKRFKAANPLDTIQAVVEAEEIVQVQDHYTQVHISDDILKYMITIVEKTRVHPDVILGASPRGSQALLKAVQAYAVLQGRDYVSPDDIKLMVPSVLGHRIILKSSFKMKADPTGSLLDSILKDIPVPSENHMVRG